MPDSYLTCQNKKGLVKSMDVRTSFEVSGVFWEAYRACPEEDRVWPEK